MNKPIHVAMVGGGINSAVGRVHEIAMKMDNAFELVAGCFSRNPELNAQSGKLYGVAPAQIYSSTEQLIEQCHTEIDAIVIATPIQSHASAIHLALDHNLKVISDKPLLSNMQECADLLKRVTPENTEVFSIFNYTGYPAVREMKRRIESGQIGHVFKIMAEMPQDSYMRLSNQNKTSAIQPWRLKDGDIDCLSLDLFAHLHSLVHFLCNKKPQTVAGISRSIAQVAPGLIDEVDALIGYEDNLIVNAWYGKAILGCRNGLKIRVFGTKGSLQWHQENPEMIACADALGNRSLIDRITSDCTVSTQLRYNRFKAGHPSGFIEAFANYYTDIAQAIHSNSLNEYTLSTGVAIQGLALCDALVKACKQRTTIDFEQHIKELKA